MTHTQIKGFPMTHTPYTDRTDNREGTRTTEYPARRRGTLPARFMITRMTAAGIRQVLPELKRHHGVWLVFTTIMALANDRSGRLDLGWELLALKADVSTRTIDRAAQTLDDLGLVAYRGGYVEAETGRHVVSRWTVNLTNIAELCARAGLLIGDAGAVIAERTRDRLAGLERLPKRRLKPRSRRSGKADTKSGDPLTGLRPAPLAAGTGPPIDDSVDLDTLRAFAEQARQAIRRR